MAQDNDAEARNDRRAEYAAVVAYHNGLVLSRFTIAGLYLTATGLLASLVLGRGPTWAATGAVSLLATWFTVCIWVLELRTRALYTNVAHRGIEIEHGPWSLVGGQWYQGFFSRQYKELPPAKQAEGVPAIPPAPDSTRFLWSRKEIPPAIARWISHTTGFDGLYLGGFLFWFLTLVVSLIAAALDCSEQALSK